MEIAYVDDEPLPLECACSAHGGVADAHADAHGAAGEVASGEAGEVGFGGMGLGVKGRKRGVVGFGMEIAPGRGVDAFPDAQEVGPERVVGLGFLGVHADVEDLEAGAVAEPVVRGVVRPHGLLRVGMDEEAAARLDGVDELSHSFAGEGGISEMALDAAGEFIFGEFGQKFREVAAVREEDVVVHPLALGLAVGDLGSGFGSGDEEAVLPLGLVHVADLLVVEDGGEVHL